MTETETETVTTLEAHHKRALLNADHVSFQYHEGQGFIRAHRRGEHTASGFDEHVDINTHTRVENYQGDGHRRTYACFHMVMSSRFDTMMRTLVNRMRKGDELHLTWVRGNDNPLLREINWHRDELHLGIRHASGPKHDETYLVGVQTGPDNTARMVRLV